MDSPRDADAGQALAPWAWLRACLISAVLLVQIVAALPDRGVLPSQIAAPEGQRVVGWIQAVLRAAGMRVENAALGERLVNATAAYATVRNAALAPFDAWFWITQTHQQWRLFTNPKRECHRLQIEARRKSRKRVRDADDEAGWRVIYRAGELDRAQLASLLRYRRVRATYNASAKHGDAQAYERFVNWLARRLFAEQPKYVAIRARMERIAIGDPGTPPQTLGWDEPLTRKRSELR